LNDNSNYKSINNNYFYIFDSLNAVTQQKEHVAW